MIRRAAFVVLLFYPILPLRAAAKEQVIGIKGYSVEMKVTESYNRLSSIRAECIIPCSQRVVWNVLSDYDNLENVIPAVSISSVLQEGEKKIILHQEGSAGIWLFKRAFSVTFRVDEVPMSYIGFDAFKGDFTRFEGSWQIAQRGEGTWVSHKVEIEPDFFVPKWALRRMARKMMFDTLKNVIDHCLAVEAQSNERGNSARELAPEHP